MFAFHSFPLKSKSSSNRRIFAIKCQMKLNSRVVHNNLCDKWTKQTNFISITILLRCSRKAKATAKHTTSKSSCCLNHTKFNARICIWIDATHILYTLQITHTHIRTECEWKRLLSFALDSNSTRLFFSYFYSQRWNTYRSFVRSFSVSVVRHSYIVWFLVRQKVLLQQQNQK